MKSIVIFLLLVFTFEPKALAYLTDAQYAKLLAEGSGGLIVKVNYYKTKPGYKPQASDQNLSTEAFIQKAAVLKGIVPATSLYYLVPGSKTKQDKFKTYQRGSFFMLVEQPGEYTITQATFMGGSFGFRIFEKATIEPGKIKYLGELNVLDPRLARQSHSAITYTFNPQPFLTDFAKAFPLTSAKVFTQKLDFREE